MNTRTFSALVAALLLPTTGAASPINWIPPAMDAVTLQPASGVQPGTPVQIGCTVRGKQTLYLDTATGMGKELALKGWQLQAELRVNGALVKSWKESGMSGIGATRTTTHVWQANAVTAKIECRVGTDYAPLMTAKTAALGGLSHRGFTAAQKPAGGPLMPAAAGLPDLTITSAKVTRITCQRDGRRNAEIAFTVRNLSPSATADLSHLPWHMLVDVDVVQTSVKQPPYHKGQAGGPSTLGPGQSWSSKAIVTGYLPHMTNGMEVSEFHVTVDRGNAVAESNEKNNHTWAVAKQQPGKCGPARQR